MYIQNHKMGWKVLSMEILITMCMLKPAVDAGKVASGAEKDVNMTMNAEMEMTLSRGVEIVCESLPSGIMQVYAFLLAKEKSKAAAVSLVLSAMTTGFVGTVISWDLDTSPSKRKLSSEFYGYVKNDQKSRTFTFLAMFMITCSHVLMKTMAASLVMCVNGVWLMLYLGGDMLLFLLVKIIRGDFRYWINLPNKLSVLISFVIRFFAKILVDFSLILHFRHSFEIGGVQFSLLLLQNQVSCFVAAWVYLKCYDGSYDAEGD